MISGPELSALLQVIFVDLVLAGDNAIVVGMVAAGLPADIAARLARATVAGSGELARLSEEAADQLRRNVTSPGGTTEAALNVLMAGDGLDPLLKKAVQAAFERSKELAG